MKNSEVYSIIYGSAVQGVRLSKNCFGEIRFPVLGRISSAEGGDVGASVTEADGILAKVGTKDQPEEVFGQAHVAAFYAVGN